MRSELTDTVVYFGRLDSYLGGPLGDILLTTWAEVDSLVVLEAIHPVE